MRAAIKALPVAERKGNGDPRHCWKCQAFKPDRVHHCSVCQECVLKMYAVAALWDFCSRLFLRVFHAQ
jgi:hypothetical protein